MIGGEHLIVLGREAFFWFGLNQDTAVMRTLEAFWERDDRYESSIALSVAGAVGARRIMLHPLPHPSPLTAPWYGRLPGLLAARRQALGVGRAPWRERRGP